MNINPKSQRGAAKILHLILGLRNSLKDVTINVRSKVRNSILPFSEYVLFKNNGAKVVKAELIYTTNGGVLGEIWFPINMELTDDKVSIALPKGTTHYVFNLVDENNFLISYPEPGYLKTTKVFATKAIVVE